MNISILQICLISLFYCFSNISWPFGSMGQWATINRPLVGGLVVGLILGNPVQGHDHRRDHQRHLPRPRLRLRLSAC